MSEARQAVETSNEYEWNIVQKIERKKGKTWNGGRGEIPFNEEEPYINVGEETLLHCTAKYYLGQGHKILSYKEYIDKAIKDGRITKAWLLKVTLDNKEV